MEVDKKLLQQIAIQMENAWNDRVAVMSGRMQDVKIGFAYAEAVKEETNPNHEVCLILLDIYYFYAMLMQYHLERYEELEQYKYNQAA